MLASQGAVSPATSAFQAKQFGGKNGGLWAAMGGGQPIEGDGGWGNAGAGKAPKGKKSPFQPTQQQPQQGGMNYSTYGTFQQPQYISDQNTQSVMNNQLAQGDAASDLRGILKGFAQPGRSLGRGEKYRAGVQSANTQQNSRFDAGQTAMNDAAQNSKMKTDFEYARDMEGQGLGALQNMLTQGNWANQFSMQQNAARQLSQRQQAALQVLGPLYAMYQ